MPLNVTRPREFVYWSVIIILRCCLLVTCFGINGIYYTILCVIIPTMSIFAMTIKLDFEGDQGVTYIIAPILVTVIGGTIFNYIVAAE